MARHRATSTSTTGRLAKEEALAVAEAVFDALAALVSAVSLEEVAQVRERLAHRLQASCCDLVEPGMREGLTDALATCEDSWLRWSVLQAQIPGGPVARELAALADAGVRDGLVCPVTGPGGCRAVLLVLFARTVRLGDAEADLFCLLAQGLWLTVNRLHRQSAAGAPVVLTAREVECLSWVLEGKTNWEIGVVTGVSARTVQFHLANAARKLDATNRVQAGVKALMAGLVPPPPGARAGLGGPAGGSGGRVRSAHRRR